MSTFNKLINKYIKEEIDLNDPNRKRFNIPDDDDESDVDTTKPILFIKKDASKESNIKNNMLGGGDCVVRAISIATEDSYDKIYKDLEYLTKKIYNKKFSNIGIRTKVTEKYLNLHGYKKVYDKPYRKAYKRSYKTQKKTKFDILDAVNKYGCDDLLVTSRDFSYVENSPVLHFMPIKSIYGYCIVFDVWKECRYSEGGDKHFSIYPSGTWVEVVQVFRKK